MIGKRIVSTLVLASFLGLQPGLSPAWADNQMGYRMLPQAEASSLAKAGGTLGLNVGPGQQITSGGLTFKLLRVNSVKPGASGAQAGFRTGDQIISVDGRVFPSVPAFAGYVGSVAPGQQINVDFLPSGSGPQGAQRVTATLGGGATAAIPTTPVQPAPDQPAAVDPKAGTLSTGTKIAIGTAAVALFGCYKLGCFNRFKKPAMAR